ncbi:V-type ATP synthase subunit C [Methanobacterium ferruginis]|jgi:V/A-type H+-transporting ATPase subunit C|uniref:V-type ATP synthase subunit C n=1 Tax=Methanobacterium ferruginis TaxID=710191 RepID=UPI0025723933|nr:V-type ATP synthase subunit C [Methanobacterium ferruginis]MCC7550111.1 V-type ATP synthase subunit C [Methanobacterium sp.]BDZ66697.1 ATP synthase subunit C [Methanobacterium ferruginis]
MVEDIATLVTSLGFPSIESFLGLIILVLLIIGAIVVIVTIRPVQNIFPYTYPNARVRGRAGKIFTEKQFSEIIEAGNIDEVKNYLRGFPDYAKYIDQYPLEKALDTQLAENYDLIARITPANSRDAFKFLLKKWDIRNIKSIVIAKKAGLSAEETLDLVVPFGDLTAKLDALVDANDINEVLSALEGTEYTSIIEDAIPVYEETGMLLPMEASLDKYLLENLLRTITTPEDDNTALLKSYVGSMVDAANLKIILRAKVDGLKFEDIDPYMISDGYQIREWKLKDLMEAEDVSGVVSGLEGTEYAQVLSEAMSQYTETGSIGAFETALDKNVSETAKRISLKNQFGIGPMIGFLSKKEKEIKNLKIIVRGKREEGFTPAMIKEMLI